MIHNNTTITTGSSIISLTGVTVLALLLMIIIIITSLMPLQALAQSDTIGGGQAAENNNSSTTTTLITNANTSSTISGEELTFRDLFEKVNSSVVQITSSGILNFSSPMLPPDGDDDDNDDDSQPPQPRTAIGSGFVIDREGHVATNDHVIANARNVSVAFSDGSVYTAKVIGSDPFSDSAVLELQNVPAEKLVPLPLGNSSNLTVGEEVAAIGNPFGLTGSMTTGVVSGLGRLLPIQTTNITTTIPGAGAFSIPNIIQTDAAINPGNSGGPLLNKNGEVVGLNTAGLLSGQFSSGIGFSIPSDTLGRIVPALIANGTYLHPWIGVAGPDIIPEIALALGLGEARGFLVTEIAPGSPADKSGIRGGDMPVMNITGFEELRLGGDIIMNVDDQKVNKTDDLLSYIETNKQVGDTVTMTILRDGNLIEIDLVLGARPMG